MIRPMLTDKVHPEISKILLQHSPWFSCPFCKDGIKRNQNENNTRVYYNCQNNKCQHQFGVYNYYSSDDINFIKLPMVCRLAFRLSQTKCHVDVIYDKEPTTALTLYNNNEFQTEVIQIKAAPKFNFQDIQSIKDKIKLWMTFS